jgi:uncharacterized damage-inducible protein DinB
MTKTEFFLHRWAEEMPLTLGVLQALPDAKLDYRPHEKCRTARSTVGHLLGQVEDLNELATASGANHHRVEIPFETIADALDMIHHRGQLSTYIRPMGGNHPDICGPSGDSRPH